MAAERDDIRQNGSMLNQRQETQGLLPSLVLLTSTDVQQLPDLLTSTDGSTKVMTLSAKPDFCITAKRPSAS